MFFKKRKKIRCPKCGKKTSEDSTVCPHCNFRLIFPKLKRIDGLLSDCYFHDKDPA